MINIINGEQLGTVLLKDLRKLNLCTNLKPEFISNRTLGFKPRSYSTELCLLLF